MRPSSLDTFRPFASRPHSPQPPAMPRPAVQLGVLDGQLPRENAAVVQGCVPLVMLKGDSYRLRGKRPRRPLQPHGWLTGQPTQQRPPRSLPATVRCACLRLAARKAAASRTLKRPSFRPARPAYISTGIDAARSIPRGHHRSSRSNRRAASRVRSGGAVQRGPTVAGGLAPRARAHRVFPIGR